LTIIFDETKIMPVGFKLKGFKHVFNMHLKSRFELIDKQFLLLAAAIEAVCTELGDTLFSDDEAPGDIRLLGSLPPTTTSSFIAASFRSRPRKTLRNVAP